ncbi:MAG: glycosyl hydrolase, partial [Verrucomicrobia bacterium]|nr:glycosyl hydrolase [Verrucomicrobiota bacterium]
MVFFLRQATLCGVISHMTMSNSLLCRTVLPTLPILLWTSAAISGNPAPSPSLAWPEITRQSRPGAYWWWMGSSVDAKNLTHELQRYREAGMGGVHIIPIYGAKGFETNYVDYLSPPWMDMLRHTVVEAQRLYLNVDMTMGSGWCLGGPNVAES